MKTKIDDGGTPHHHGPMLARKSEAARARELLSTIRPLAQWMKETRPTALDVTLARAVVAEAIRLADLTPEQAEGVAAALELHEAVAIAQEKRDVH
jgi:hypothetical protein